MNLNAQKQMHLGARAALLPRGARLSWLLLFIAFRALSRRAAGGCFFHPTREALRRARSERAAATEGSGKPTGAKRGPKPRGGDTGAACTPEGSPRAQPEAHPAWAEAAHLDPANRGGRERPEGAGRRARSEATTCDDHQRARAPRIDITRFLSSRVVSMAL
jgi:hypothetical protein